MKNQLIIVCLLASYIVIAGCSSKGESFDKKQLESTATYEIIHYNVVFAPDLSNRLNKKLNNRPLKDEQIVESVIKNIYPTILRHGRSENQQDKFSVSFMNRKLISEYNINTALLNIDFAKFQKQRERIDYIKSRNPKSAFAADTVNFVKEFSRVNSIAAVNTFGADIWTYFNSGVDNVIVKSNPEPTKFNGHTYENKFRNIMVLLTDGYLEAGIYGKEGCPSGNQCYYLDNDRINKFRNAFKKSGEKDIKVFFEKNNYGIVPVDNPYLKDLEVLVMELYDRSLSKGGSATVHPTDMEIMKLFWTNWLEKSNVKRFELRPIASTENEAEKVILDFIGIRN